MKALSSQDVFLKHFDQVDRLPDGAHLRKVRQAARNRFREQTFPDPRTEDWRFTNVTGMLKIPFEPALVKPATNAARVPAPVAQGAIRLVFINGFFAADLSNVATAPTTVHVGNLAQADLTKLPEIPAFLARLSVDQDQIFTTLNTGVLRDGAYLIVPDSVQLTAPVEIDYFTTPGQENLAISPRTLLVLGKNSHATVVERYVPLGGSKEVYFNNVVTEVALAQDARLDHYKVQEEGSAAYHVAATQVQLAARSNFSTHFLSLGGDLVRNEVHVRFAGEFAEATVNGLYLASGTQHIDNFTVIDHAVPNCASHELYKGVLSDQSHGVFNGKIFVRPDAQKTDAKQTNKVLLLSDTATINTKPQLEIFADDVKCTHGATIGQLDAEGLFYLQSRGIGLEEARSLLTFAFANDVCSRIKIEPLRQQMEEMLIGRRL